MTQLQSPVEIEQDLDQTRLKISQTLEQIGERVSPSALQDVASSSMVQARQYLESEADQILGRVSEQIPRASLSITRLVRRHPLKVAGLGLLIGFLLNRGSNRPTSLQHPQPNKEIKSDYE